MGASHLRAACRLEPLEDRVLLANNVFTVTAINDNGTGQAGTLGAAINGVNGSAVGDTNTIAFNLANPATVNVTGQLPAITKPVTIDGWTQNNNNAGVWVEVSGPGGAGNAFDGLTFSVGGCTVRGLAVDKFNGNGIVVNNPTGTTDTIYSCNIGTDLTGTAANKGNTQNGVLIQGPSNVIGDCCFWNVISGNGWNGIDLTGANAKFNTISGNDIGVDNTGKAALKNNQQGVLIESGAANNTVGDAAPVVSPSNVISGNGQFGVYIDTSNNNRVLDNNIGLGSDGTTIVGNARSGVRLINSGTGNHIGEANLGNVISGNTEHGVTISGGANLSGNSVVGNLIGTDKTGTVKKANLQDGVFLNAPSNTIGGTNAGQANTISGNGHNGVTITGAQATANTVSVNLIGTDTNGSAALGNGNDGVFIGGGSGNDTIGTAGANNPWTVISGNGNAGIEIVGGNANTVVHCLIGTDITGTKKQDANQNNFGNTQYGIVIGSGGTNGVASNNNTIGGIAGVAAGVGNVISGNGTTGAGNRDFGIAIPSPTGASSTGNNIFGNYIGTDKTGTQALGNNNDGVYVEVNSNNTTIDSNVISANGHVDPQDGPIGVGVWMDGSNNLVQNNKIGLDWQGNVVMALANKNGWRGSTGDPTANGNVWQNNQHN